MNLQLTTKKCKFKESSEERFYACFEGAESHLNQVQTTKQGYISC